MTYGTSFLRCSFEFVAATTTEIAMTDLTIAPPIASPTVATDMLADYAGSDLQTFASLLNTCMSAGAWGDYSTLTSMKLSAVGTNGILLTDPLTHNLSPTYAGTVHQVHPQLSVVLSLWSGHTIGGGNFGRMFLPHFSNPLVNGSPRSASADAASLAAAGAVFITGVNSVATTMTHPGQVSIMSQAVGHPFKTVAFVRVGRVTDTQRRRYDRLDEEYHDVAV